VIILKNRFGFIKVFVILFACLLLTSCASQSPTANGSTGSAVNTSNDLSFKSDTTSSETSSVENITNGALLLSSFKMISPTIGWACNDNSIYRTIDGGEQWYNITPKDIVSPLDTITYYLDVNTAWVAASSKTDSNITVFRTNNGGQTWQPVRVSVDNLQTIYTLSSINFINSKRGWLMVQPDHGVNSEPAQLFSTTDGGATWTSTAITWGSENPEKPIANSLPFGGTIFFQNTEIGWLTGSYATTTYKELYMTQDGGRTWKQQKINLPSSLSDGELDITTPHEFFSNDSKDDILIVTFNPNNHETKYFATIFYITHDGGLTWQDMKIIKGLNVTADFVNSNEWWYWGSQPPNSFSTAPVLGKFYNSTNGGSTWQVINPDKALNKLLEKGQNIIEVDFIDNKTGWVLVSSESNSLNTLFKTNDGGNTWEQIHPK
jgi:photosystem II stability/assembly factor-like uncharacterized protein